MTQAEKYRNLAMQARSDAYAAGGLPDGEQAAREYRAEAIRYERLAKLAELGQLEAK